MHDHNDNNFSGMMWMMAICCLGPLIIVFFAGRATGGLSTWLVFGALAICLGAHFFMHRGHKHPDAAPPEEDKHSPNQLK